MRIRTTAYFIILFLINALAPLRWIRLDYVIVDLAETTYHVKELALGRVPYRDIFSHHFLGYLLPFYLAELLKPITPFGMKTLCILFNFVSCILIYLVVKALISKQGALWAGLVTATLGWCPQWQGDTFNNPSYFLPILYLVIFLLFDSYKSQSNRKYLCASMVFGGLITFDQRLVVFAPLLALPIICGAIKFNTKILLKAFVFSLTPPLLAVAWLASHGALHDFWQQTVIFPFLYRNQGQTNLQTVLAHLIIDGGLLGSPIVSVLFLSGALLIVLLATDRMVRLLVLSWPIMGVAYMAFGGRAYAHYLMIFCPWVVLVISLAPEYLRTRSVNGSIVYKVLTLIAIIVGFAPFFAEYRKSGTLFVEPDKMVISDTASFIREHSVSSDNILIWGYSQAMYLLSERFSGFRDMGLISVAGANYSSTRREDQGIVPSMVDEFKHFLQSKPPKLFVYYKKNITDCRTCFGVAPLQFNFDFNKVEHLNYVREFVQSKCTHLKTFESNLDRAEVFECVTKTNFQGNQE